jgi:hypothetical protein
VSIENARRLGFIGRYVESGTQTPQNPLSEISGDDEFPADAVRASLTDQLVWPNSECSTIFQIFHFFKISAKQPDNT